MAILSPARPRLAASTRLILAMFQLYADVETGFGQAVLNMLKKQYPDQKIDATASQIGHKMMSIVRKQNQYNDDRSMDTIQDFLTYLTTGSRYLTEVDPKTGKKAIVKDENGNPVERDEKTKKEWDFAKDSPTWQSALDKIYANLRTRGISKSKENQLRKKKEKSTDDAFGKRGEGGGAPEGGEAHMPTGDEGALGKALDDHAAIKEFIDLIDSYLPDLKKTLTPATGALFSLIFDDDIGGFGSDIQDNMGQASALKDKLMKGTPEQQALYEKNAKRWSGFVGDTRKKLLDEIWEFIDKHMTPGDYQMLKETFFADTTPKDVNDLRNKKEQEKSGYQDGIDERKLARLKWKDQNNELTPDEKKTFESLSKKMKAKGIDLDKIEPVKPEPKKEKKEKAAPGADSSSSDQSSGQTAQASNLSIAARIAARTWH